MLLLLSTFWRNEKGEVTQLKSMTGYGRTVSQQAGYEISMEIRSVNHRFLECSVKLPRNYGYLEEKIKERLQSRISRGKVEVTLSLRQIEGKTKLVEVQHETVCAYLSALLAENKRLATELEGGVSSDAYLCQDLGLSALLRLPDVFQIQSTGEDEEQVWDVVAPVLDETLRQFVAMRQTEGERLQADIAQHLSAVEQMATQVETLVPASVEQYYQKLYVKLQELLVDQTVDESRLVTEAAVFAEKTAVDEELVRLHSHIAQFRDFLESNEPVGRKMDFLVQEMNREVNTTGSKSQSLEITRLVVDMKAEIEKIREQIQNVE